MRTSRPSAASRPVWSASTGGPLRKGKVVPPSISFEGRRRWVRTKVGVWNGGRAPPIRALPGISQGLPLRQALVLMQGTGAHLGGVLDARGRAEGIVTPEDMLEELILQIRDDNRTLQAR